MTTKLTTETRRQGEALLLKIPKTLLFPLGGSGGTLVPAAWHVFLGIIYLVIGGIMLKGFRQFIMRGNVIDLAVAVVIGAAFGVVVTSFVTNIITPLIAAIVGK